MDFTDYTWDDIASTFVKENILGSEFSFGTKTDLAISIDYIPKIQARKIYTYAKEQLDLLKNPVTSAAPVQETAEPVFEEEAEEIEEVETEEVTSFAEILPAAPVVTETYEPLPTHPAGERKLSDLSKEELFDKLQNYKKLLDNGLIMQGEYDAYKKEILSYM